MDGTITAALFRKTSLLTARHVVLYDYVRIMTMDRMRDEPSIASYAAFKNYTFEFCGVDSCA